MNMTVKSVLLKNFKKIRLSRWTIYLNHDFEKFPLDTFLKSSEHHDGIRGPFKKIPSSPSAKVCTASLTFSGKKCDLYLKQYLYRSCSDSIIHLFRPSRAARAAAASLMLAQHGFSIPPVIAVGHFNHGPFKTKHFLITLEIKNAHDLYFFLNAECCLHKIENLKTKRQFIKNLGKTIGRMHNAQIAHGDLRPGNIFAKQTDTDFAFSFIDNERTRKFPKLPPNLRIKNLIQVNMVPQYPISNTDRMRFFNAYLNENPQCRKNRKTLARTVLARTDQRLSKRSN